MSIFNNFHNDKETISCLINVALTFSRFIDFKAESIDFTTPAIEFVT